MTTTVLEKPAATEKVAEKAGNKPIAIPKTLGAATDLLYRLREQRLDLQRQADAVGQQEKALGEHILQKLGEQGLDGCKGKVATFASKTDVKASITDWPKFYAWAVKHKEYDLLYKQASIRALKERWDAGKVVPGADRIEVSSYSLTKAGK